MLEKPDLQNELIIACLQQAYDLGINHLEFLPIGADQNTAVYAVECVDNTRCFLKLRSGLFEEASVTLPKYLSDMGVQQIISPLSTLSGQLWAELDHFKVLLYPFIEGRNGYEIDLADEFWTDLGSALKRVHTTVVPDAILRHLRHETYSPKWRNIVRAVLGQVGQTKYEEPVAVRLAAFIFEKHREILDLIERAEQQAKVLASNPPPSVLCHTDIHAGNLLITDAGEFYIVDWDDPLLAPKERDLMYIGGGLMGGWHPPRTEENLIYRGYGPVEINPHALAYYRYERIIQDIAVYCEQILLSSDGGEDRKQSLQYLKSNFLPNSTIELAYLSDLTNLS